jgi:hypothetical protein
VNSEHLYTDVVVHFEQADMTLDTKTLVPVGWPVCIYITMTSSDDGRTWSLQLVKMPTKGDTYSS